MTEPNLPTGWWPDIPEVRREVAAMVRAAHDPVKSADDAFWHAATGTPAEYHPKVQAFLDRISE